MDRFDPERDPDLAGVVQVLERERPVLTFDEIERLDRRLNAFLAQPRAPRRRMRLSVVICLAVGLLLMTAGTGLAISGFATPGAADHAQYPDRTSNGPPPSNHPPRSNRPSASNRPPASSHPSASVGGRAGSGQGARDHRSPSSLGQIRRTGRAPTVSVALTRAATHNDLPFAGVNAIPILLAGVVLIITGAAMDGRGRGRRRRL